MYLKDKNQKQKAEYMMQVSFLVYTYLLKPLRCVYVTIRKLCSGVTASCSNQFLLTCLNNNNLKKTYGDTLLQRTPKWIKKKKHNQNNKHRKMCLHMFFLCYFHWNSSVSCVICSSGVLMTWPESPEYWTKKEVFLQGPQLSSQLSST